MINKVFKLFSQYKNEFRKGRKAKTYIPEKYEALPEWMKVKQKDPHDYKLRKKDEIKNWLEEEFEKDNFYYELRFSIYLNEVEPFDHLSNKVKLVLFPDKMGLSKLQKKRLIDLAGVRFDKKKRFIHVTSNHYDSWEYNYKKAAHMGQELYMESIRAPLDEIEDEGE